MAKAGSEAEHVFWKARKGRTLEITPSYKRELRGAVYRDYRQADMCTILNNLIFMEAVEPEARSILLGVSDWMNSDERRIRKEGGKSKMIEIQAETKQQKEEKERLEREIDARMKRLKEIETELAPYSNAGSILEAAYKRKAEILGGADNEKKQILAEANDERLSILTNARMQEKQIIESAKAMAETIKKEAEAEKDRILKEEIRKIDRVFPEYRSLIEEEYSNEAEVCRKTREQTGEDVIKLMRRLEKEGDSERNNFSNSEEALRSSMQENFSKCIDVFTQAIDTLRKENEKRLSEQKQSFLDHLGKLSQSIQSQSIVRQNRTASDIQSWKADFYKLEYKGLASFYRLFAASTSGAGAREDELYADLKQRIAEGQADPTEVDPLLIELHNRNCNMIKLESQLKNALSRIGIIEYVPKIGDEFDYDLHTCKGDTDFPEDGARITNVLENGMVLKRAGEKDVVLLQATVEVENGGDQ